MRKKGLGKGLDALFGDDADLTASNDFEYLPLQRIEPRQEQPRKFFEKDSLDQLADSIRLHGVFSPIIVRSAGNGFYQIIAGERRWRAAREAGLTEIPVRIVKADDKVSLEISMIENLQRENLTPIEEAYGYKDLMEDYDMTQEEVAQRVSKSRPAIANSLRLLSLPDELKKLVEQDKLSVGSARALLALKCEERMKDAAKIVISGDMNVREVEALVRKLSKQKPSKQKQTNLEVDYILEAQKRLTTALGRRVTIKQSKGKGKIELEYYDPEDFDVLFDSLLAGEVTKND